MELESITCSNCGAPLQVPPGVQFVTCKHCQTSLAIHRSDSATYTEKIAQIDERTHEMAGELARLRYESELARIDREWKQERRQYLVSDKDGRLTEPSEGASVLVAVGSVVFGVVWMAGASSMPDAGAFPLFGLLAIAFGIGSAIYNFSKANELDEARRRYEKRRSQLSIKQFIPDDSKAQA